MNKEFVIDALIKNKVQIFNKVGRDSVLVYTFIQNSKDNPSIRPVFKIVYSSFYQLNSVGLTNQWKEKYFGILFTPSLILSAAKPEDALEKVLVYLSQISENKIDSRVQFSFATKLLHTLNTNLPIYDSLIRRESVLDLPNFNSETTGERIKSRVEIYKILLQDYEILLEDNRVKELILEFKRYFISHEMSDTKALDFLLWGLGKLDLV